MGRHAIINPMTGRRVLKTGAIGRQIAKGGGKGAKKPTKKKASTQNKPRLASKTCYALPKKSPLTRCKFQSSTRSRGPTSMLQSVNFVLHVKTTNTSPQQGMLLNRFEEPDSEIVTLRAGPLERFDSALDQHIELGRDDVNRPGFIGNELPLESIWKDRGGRTVAETRRTFKTKKGFFTVGEVVKAVEKFERIDRPKSKWFGGVDCHHVFFEGLFPNAEKTAFCIFWGS